MLSFLNHSFVSRTPLWLASFHGHLEVIQYLAPGGGPGGAQPGTVGGLSSGLSSTGATAGEAPPMEGPWKTSRWNEDTRRFPTFFCSMLYMFQFSIKTSIKQTLSLFYVHKQKKRVRFEGLLYVLTTRRDFYTYERNKSSFKIVTFIWYSNDMFHNVFVTLVSLKGTTTRWFASSWPWAPTCPRPWRSRPGCPFHSAWCYRR